MLRPVPTSRALWAPALGFASIRRQETLLILLNLAAMAGLMSLHIVFRPVIGQLTALATLAFVIRFAMQLGELALLSRTSSRLRTLQPQELFSSGTNNVCQPASGRARRSRHTTARRAVGPQPSPPWPSRSSLR